MGQSQAKSVVEAATSLASPTPLQSSDFERFPLFWTVPFTRRDTYTEIPAKIFVDMRKSNPQKFALLIAHVRPNLAVFSPNVALGQIPAAFAFFGN